MPDDDADDGCIAVNLKALGVPIRVKLRGRLASDLAAQLRRAWSWCEGSSDVAGPVVELSVHVDPDPNLVATSGTEYAGTDVAFMMHAIPPLITERAVDACAGRLLMFHAGALADHASGRTVGLVAPSGTGKTTAVSELGQHFAYVTDETLAIDDQRRVTPYPKPLSVLGSRSDQIKMQVCPDDAGLSKPTAPLVLEGLVLLRREPDGPASPVIETLPTLEALVALSPETSSLSRLPRPLHLLADVLDATGGLRSVRYREAHTLAPAVRNILGAAGMMVRRGEFVDWYVEGSRSVVLLEDQSFLLSDLATEVVRIVGEGVDVEALHNALVDRFGEPPGDDPLAATRSMVGDLVQTGVLRTTP